MPSHLSPWSIIYITLVGIACIVGAVYLFATEHTDGAIALLVIAFPAVGLTGQQARVHQLTKQTNDVVTEIANGRTEALVRKVVGQELAKFATAQQGPVDYEPPPEADQPPSPATPSGGGDMPVSLTVPSP